MLDELKKQVLIDGLSRLDRIAEALEQLKREEK